MYLILIQYKELVINNQNLSQYYLKAISPIVVMGKMGWKVLYIFVSIAENRQKIDSTL